MNRRINKKIVWIICIVILIIFVGVAILVSRGKTFVNFMKKDKVEEEVVDTLTLPETEVSEIEETVVGAEIKPHLPECYEMKFNMSDEGLWYMNICGKDYTRTDVSTTGDLFLTTYTSGNYKYIVYEDSLCCYEDENSEVEVNEIGTYNTLSESKWFDENMVVFDEDTDYLYYTIKDTKIDEYGNVSAVVNKQTEYIEKIIVTTSQETDEGSEVTETVLYISEYTGDLYFDDVLKNYKEVKTITKEDYVNIMLEILLQMDEFSIGVME